MAQVRLTRDDIAALEVVADSDARFQHRLKTHHVSLKWILKRIDADAEDDATYISDDHSATSKRSKASHLSKRSLRYDNTPDPVHTILSLDTTHTVEESDGILINSPRSTFCILKNGLSVAELCAPSRQEFFNKGLLDGVSVETVHMRLAAETERRKKKMGVVKKEYLSLCEGATMEEVVEALRQHKYGREDEVTQNAEHLNNLDHYAHSGKLDISVLDSDCVDVMVKARNRTLGEIRRKLDQKDRMLQQSIEKERALFEKEAIQHEESERVQNIHQQARSAKSVELKGKRKAVDDRVSRLIAAQEEQRELRRQAIIEQRNVLDERAKSRKALDLHASQQLVELRRERGRRARKAQEEMQEYKRQQILQKQEMASRIHERQMENRKADVKKRNEEFNKLSRERRKVIRERSDNEMQYIQAKNAEVEEAAAQRAEEFQRMRELRNQAKKEHSQARAARGAATRANAEAIKMQRLLELEDNYAQKLENIDAAQRDKKERLLLENEVSAQMRAEKTEEKQRSHSAMEFRYIGYINSNQSKTDWLEREAVKRKVLTTQVRQEREAMTRAKERVIKELDEAEIKRKKRESAMRPESSMA